MVGPRTGLSILAAGNAVAGLSMLINAPSLAGLGGYAVLVGSFVLLFSLRREIRLKSSIIIAALALLLVPMFLWGGVGRPHSTSSAGYWSWQFSAWIVLMRLGDVGFFVLLSRTWAPPRVHLTLLAAVCLMGLLLIYTLQQENYVVRSQSTWSMYAKLGWAGVAALLAAGVWMARAAWPLADSPALVEPRAS
jgi:hypothetical protein